MGVTLPPPCYLRFKRTSKLLLQIHKYDLQEQMEGHVYLTSWPGSDLDLFYFFRLKSWKTEFVWQVPRQWALHLFSRRGGWNKQQGRVSRSKDICLVLAETNKRTYSHHKSRSCIICWLQLNSYLFILSYVAILKRQNKRLNKTIQKGNIGG